MSMWTPVFISSTFFTLHIMHNIICQLYASYQRVMNFIRFTRMYKTNYAPNLRITESLSQEEHQQLQRDRRGEHVRRRCKQPAHMVHNRVDFWIL